MPGVMPPPVLYKLNGAGMTVAQVADKLAVADAAIVGSTFKDTRKDAGEVSAAHVQEFMAAVDQIR